jgi:hypothetical protein
VVIIIVVFHKYFRMGYNKVADCLDFVQNGSKDWTNAKIFVFDSPTHLDKPFKERLDIAKKS